MPRIAKLIVLTTAVFAFFVPQAGAVDHRSADAVDAARLAEQAQYQDHRSPDAVDASNAALRGESVSTYTPGSSSSSSDDGFDWGLVAAGIALTLGVAGVVVMTHRRRRRGVSRPLATAGS